VKWLIITIVILCSLLFATEASKYFMPFPVAASNGRPINNATVGLYQSDTLRYAMTYLSNSAGEYYYGSQIAAGIYDIYVNGAEWRTGIYIEFGQQVVTAEISDTADVLRSEFRGEIMDTVKVNVDVIEDSINARGNIVTGAITDGTITNADIQDATIFYVKLNAADFYNGVNNANLLSAGAIATGGVATAEILDGTIVAADIQNGSITYADLDESSVVAGVNSSGLVTGSAITDGTILGADMDYTTLEDSLNTRENLDVKKFTWNFSIDSVTIERDSAFVLMYSPDSMTIDSIICLGNSLAVDGNGSVDLTVVFRYGKDMSYDVGGTSFGFSLNITSTTTGTKYGAGVVGIPAYNFIWVEFTDKTTISKQLFIAFYGSKD